MSSVKLELDFKRYLHEKAQESRKNQIQACLMFLAGALFFVGGIVTNLRSSSSAQWFIFIPYQASFDAKAVLGLSFTIGGIILMIFATSLMLHHQHERKWFMKELKRAYDAELQKANRNNKRQQVLKIPKLKGNQTNEKTRIDSK